MPGHKFVAKNKTGGGEEGTCICREGYYLWEDGACYPPFTRGPCPPGNIFQLSFNEVAFCIHLDKYFSDLVIFY